MNQYRIILKKLFFLSSPIILSNLLNAASSLITMFFIAQLSSNALAAGAIITSSYGLIMMLAVSVLYSVSIMVGKNHGASRADDVAAIVFSGIALAFILGIPFTAVMLNITTILDWLKQPTEVSALAGEYFRGMAFGFIPSLIAAVLTQFFMGISKARIIFYFTLITVVFNGLFSYLFIFGFGSFNGFGIYGAGLANSLAACLLLLLKFIFISSSSNFKIYRFFSKHPAGFRYISVLFAIGLPISLQYGTELLAFSMMTYFMGLIGTTALGAQQIALQYSMISIMVVMGFSQSASILTSQALGKNQNHQVRTIANCSLLLGCVSMLSLIIFFFYRPEWLISFYINPQHAEATTLINLSKTILMIAALTQIFDSGRNISAGILRGSGDNSSSLWISISSCWVIGIPMAAVLGFIFNYGAIGIRLGMMVGIIFGCLQLMHRVYKTCAAKSSKSAKLVGVSN